MAKYTIELRKLQAEFYEAMTDYPIFDESYRETLNDKIYHACKFREIGYETPEMFFEELKEWMDLHMPEYNWLYKSNLIELTPIQRSQIIETFQEAKQQAEQIASTNQETNNRSYNSQNQSSNGNISHSETDGTGSGTDTISESQSYTMNGGNSETVNGTSHHSDFPQANLSDTEDSDYYTSGDKDNSQTTGTNNETSSTTNTGNNSNSQTTHSETDSTSNDSMNSSGSGQDATTKNGSNNESRNNSENVSHTKITTTGQNYTDFELIEQYRKNFLNVDAKLIRDIKKNLFMNIW